MSSSTKILIYDGQCRACSLARDAVAQRDSKKQFEIVDAHSAKGKRLQKEYGLNTENSAYVIENRTLREKSDMALYVLENLNWLEKLVARIGRIVPKKAADSIYSFVVTHRKMFNR